jgi:hypothetical protein
MASAAFACDAFVGRNQVRVVGDYYLEQWEDFTTYYLNKGRFDNSGGGVLEGPVVSLGWNKTTIVGKQQATEWIPVTGLSST